MSRVKAFLNAIPQSDDFTLLSLFGGKYNVTTDKYLEFLDCYAHDLAQSVVLGLVECKASPHFPLIFDLDFPDDFQGDRLPVIKVLLTTFVDTIIEPLLNFYDNIDCAKEYAHKIVFQDSKISHRNLLKYHIVFPTIITDKFSGTQSVKHLQECMLNKYSELDWAKVLDLSVVNSNGLRMLGSFKKDAVDQGFYVPCTVNWDELSLTNQDITKEILYEHTVRLVHREDAFELLIKDNVAEYAQAPSQNVHGVRVCVPFDTLRTAVMALPASFYDGGAYNKWSRIIWTIQSLAIDGGYVEQGQELAHEFSRQAGAFYNAREVDRLYQVAQRRMQMPRLGWRSLFAQLQEHTPEIAGRLSTQVYNVAAPPDDWDPGMLSNDLIQMLGLADDTDVSFTFERDAILFRCSNDGPAGKIRRRDGAVFSGDDYMGHVAENIRIQDPLSIVHRSIPPSARWNANFTGPDQAQLQNTAGELQANIVLHNAFSRDEAYLNVTVGGTHRGSIRDRRSVNSVERRIMDGVQTQLLQQYGVVSAYFDRCTFVLSNGNASDDSTRRPEGELIGVLGEHKPNIRHMWRLDGDARSSSFNGIFRCHPESFIWERVHNAELEKQIRLEFADVPHVSEAERKWMFTRRGVSALREELAVAVLSSGFERTLDSNLDIFPLAGGMVYDMTRRILRKMCPDDRVQTTTGWKYDPAAAINHRADLERFLEQVLPIPEEREMTLRYLAGMLTGRRYIKKMICFTDKRAGNNGKSTLIKLVRSFLGDLGISDNKLLLKSSHDRGRDDHDAGLEPYKGMRGAVLEEMKRTSKIDEGLAKNITGATNVTVQGRKIGNGERYKFVWSAILILVFNEGDMPQFDVDDAAFVNRLLIAPMRSKFIVGISPEEAATICESQPYTFVADSSLGDRIDNWRSSFLDMLCERYVNDDIPDHEIPQGMKEWRAETVNERNDIARWLDENIEAFPGGFVWEKSLRTAYNEFMVQDEGQFKSVSKDVFLRALQAWMRAKPYVAKGQTRITISRGNSIQVRDAWSGCRLIESSTVNSD
jgi:phage/plasmid-associated DNA primase